MIFGDLNDPNYDPTAVWAVPPEVLRQLRAGELDRTAQPIDLLILEILSRRNFAGWQMDDILNGMMSDFDSPQKALAALRRGEIDEEGLPL